MPRNPSTGVFTRVLNSFSDPVLGEIISPTDAIQYYNDIDAGLTNSIPKEPVVETGASVTVTAGTAALAIERTAPTLTAIALPSVTAQDGVPLRIVDWSTSVVTDHEIEITPDGAETIMRAATWSIFSNAAQLASLTLYPSTTLNGWYIAP